MADQNDKQELAYLRQVNGELTRGLRRCNLLIEDCRAHLTPANSNEPAGFMLGKADDEEDEQLG